MLDRRLYQRIDSRLSVRYSIMTKGIIETAARSENISQDGILVDLNDTFNPGTRLILEIILPEQPDPVMASGEVVWQKQIKTDPPLYATGIQYVKIAENDASRLSRYVAQVIEESPQNTGNRPNRLLAFLGSLLQRFTKE